MYLIFALIFCALLVVALGVVLFVSLTSDSPPAAQPVEEHQGVAQGSANVPSGLNPSVRAPSVSSPSVQGPSATAPSVSSSGVSGGSLRAPSATAPSVSSPSVSSPSVSSPSVSSPSVSTPRVPSGQVPAATSAQTTAPAAESSGTPFLALIIILSVLLVIAVGAAVYFAVRRS